jgi:hypothetical protein
MRDFVWLGLARTVPPEPLKVWPEPSILIDLDVVDILRCPNCDALFEYGMFVCYGAKPKAFPRLLAGNLHHFCAALKIET